MVVPVSRALAGTQGVSVACVSVASAGTAVSDDIAVPWGTVPP